ncbi:hypothetical protein EKE94_16105 [Mesobaculum littorinae]|uniref:Flagellar protein FlgN n=1 Tax=Mesobaculum littorinae TaxID=2486419 RepID=A0A438ADX7_9RHOB|nr:hypothetical protein [Mesobaculum littorinae]RVV96867.1 hypothetical protein EKE94_16105 [Mesobaculum littorinae]
MSDTITHPSAAALDAILEMSALLDREEAAFAARDPQAAAALAEAKADAATRLDAALDPSLAEDPQVRAALADLRPRITRSERALSRLAQATGEIAAEFARIRKRHSLSGTYTAKGMASEPAQPASGPSHHKVDNSY